MSVVTRLLHSQVGVHHKVTSLQSEDAEQRVPFPRMPPSHGYTHHIAQGIVSVGVSAGAEFRLVESSFEFHGDVRELCVDGGGPPAGTPGSGSAGRFYGVVVNGLQFQEVIRKSCSEVPICCGC